MLKDYSLDFLNSEQIKEHKTIISKHSNDNRIREDN